MKIPPLGDSGAGFLIACGMHGFLLFGTTAMIAQPPRYEVEAGAGGIEVSLVAAPLPSQKQNAPLSIPKPPEEEAKPALPDDLALEPVPLPETRGELPYIGDGSSAVSGKDTTTLTLPGGAATGKGGRFRNPAPAYPYQAIRQGQQGVVLLEVRVDKAGRPTSVEISESSGFSLLDESALRTVRRWKFDPAHVGFLPVNARIRIPIRFVLEDVLKRLR